MPSNYPSEPTNSPQTGLILSTAASSISLLVNMEATSTQQADFMGAAFTLFLCSALLSLWASLLYLTSAIRISHPLSRPYNRSENHFLRWIFVYLLHWDTLTRLITALSW